MTTLEEAFEQFKQLPDWQRYPMPDVFYEHFKVPKPKTGLSVMESLTYMPPPAVSLNKNGRVEIRGPAEGGVREVQQLPAPPVEVKRINDETGELEDYPPPPEPLKIEDFHFVTSPERTQSEKLINLEGYMKTMTDIINQTSVGKKQDSGQTMLSLPTEHNTTETQPE